MGNFLIRTIIRSMFILTSRERALSRAGGFIHKYDNLAEGLNLEAGQQSIKVPPMPGIDEDMRKWSFYMIIEHNNIVNKSISTTIRQLVNGEPLSGAASIDPKKDVMPSESAGEEQLQTFRHSVIDHIQTIRGLRRLRGTKSAPHMIFGDFDAHKWNCMFTFHLGLHYRQAEYVVRQLKVF